MGTRSSENNSDTPKTLFRESIRSLRANLLLQAESGRRTLLIASPGPGEGKSSVAVHLACSLASLKRKVLLVDGDLRKPNLHNILGIKNTTGFADLLRNSTELVRSQVALRENLTVLTAGSVPSDPQQLLVSPRLEALLSQFEAQFEFVLVDSAPLLAVADTALMARFVQGAIMVLLYGGSTQRDIVQAKKELEVAGCPIIGCVLNQADYSTGVSSYPYMNRYSESSPQQQSEPLSLRHVARAVDYQTAEGNR